ncbi:MAG: hypothetical protein AB8F95_16235 [Bacteroidia bacterium]
MKFVPILRLAVYISLVCVMASCLRTRPVEPPGGGSSDWVSPTDYQILLDNFQRSLAERNTQNLLRCLSEDSYLFEPVASLFADNESIWRNWARQDERIWFENMQAVLDITSNSLQLTEIDLQDVTADSLRYVGNYRLRITHTDTTLPTLFLGQIQFNMKVNAFNEWEISRWTDLEVTPDSSWTLLKLRFTQ